MEITERQRTNFWKKVEGASDPDGCWIWTGYRTPQGYGQFGVVGGTRLATHVALEIAGRPRPGDAFALHGNCSNPACVNPAHLRWGDQAENMDDMKRLGRANPVRGEASPKAKLTPDLIKLIRNSRVSQRKLAAEIGVPRGTISGIKLGTRWRHLS
jgi:hypothetical protein